MLKFTTIDTFSIAGRGVVHTGYSPVEFDTREPDWSAKLMAEPREVDGVPRRVKGIEVYAALMRFRAGTPIGLLLAPKATQGEAGA